MPSARHAQPLPAIPAQRVNNFISLDKYYRSAELLIRQSSEYEKQGNELQQYTMLMRLASLVIETMPKHKDFKSASSEYRTLRKELGRAHMPTLEVLKVSLRLKVGEDSSIWTERPASHTPDAVNFSTSNLPQLDWDRLAQPSSSQAVPSQANWLEASEGLPQQRSGPPDLLTGPPSTFGKGGTPGVVELPTFRHDLRSASQASRERHTLLSKPSGGSSRRPTSAGDRSLYPQFDATPAVPPVLANEMEGSQMITPPSLMDELAAPLPSLQLQPQEMEVHSMAPLDGPPDLGGTCRQSMPEPPPPPPTEQPGKISELREVREVHVSMALMEDFLAYAQQNTRRGIESCGILAGLLDSKRGLFRISTLIIPKQEGTSDTVQALAEEEIFDVQDKRGLYPMGWIHTHPTQTCFLSSIDVHTQCGYQTMLEEAVAIVMAPTDRTKRCGMFRLSTPGGLKLVQKCQLRGFHTHPVPETGQPVYELCGHVYLNERLKHDVIDLR